MHEFKLNDNATLFWLGHDGFKIKTSDKIIYIDPFQMNEDESADIVLITHAHHDHLSIEDLKKVVNAKTIILATVDCASKLAGNVDCKMQIVEPNKKYNVLGLEVETVPAYNVNKFRSVGVPFHQKQDGWVGYIINVSGTKVYHTGDSDLIPEMSKIKTNVLLIPVSGTYVMTHTEAANACDVIKPDIAIPMHYDKLVGTIEDAKEFKKLAKCAVEIL